MDAGSKCSNQLWTGTSDITSLWLFDQRDKWDRFALDAVKKEKDASHRLSHTSQEWQLLMGGGTHVPLVDRRTKIASKAQDDV